jgi:hypothetical protein
VEVVFLENSPAFGEFPFMGLQHGLSCPVIVPTTIDRQLNYSQITAADLVAMSAEELASVDPLAMNLIVAKGIPQLARLDISHYQQLVDRWVLDLNRRCLPQWEPYFHEAPQDFENDIRYFRLGMVCQYLDQIVGIKYNLKQRDSKKIHYTNPSDLFLNGLLDTQEGTCGNMATLHVAMGWRMGWPVSLACVNAHYILRFDDGETIYNVEATNTGNGGFSTNPDSYIIKQKQLPNIAIESGSDLRALRPHEMLGCFVGLRARHIQDIGLISGNEQIILQAEHDWLLARQLFPTNRILFRNQMAASFLRGYGLFSKQESGHPETFGNCIMEIQERRAKQPKSMPLKTQYLQQTASAETFDDFFATMEIPE